MRGETVAMAVKRRGMWMVAGSPESGEIRLSAAGEPARNHRSRAVSALLQPRRYPIDASNRSRAGDQVHPAKRFGIETTRRVFGRALSVSPVVQPIALPNGGGCEGEPGEPHPSTPSIESRRSSPPPASSTSNFARFPRAQPIAPLRAAR
jgi:hypothetical protein